MDIQIIRDVVELIPENEKDIFVLGKLSTIIQCFVLYKPSPKKVEYVSLNKKTFLDYLVKNI